jgi:hypothetical protein
MHRELKRETARPPAASFRGQQRRFDAFRTRYNTERPHEGIGDRIPASLWHPSGRPFPSTSPRRSIPRTWRFGASARPARFRLGSQQIFLSHALEGQDIALEEVDDGVWSIVCYRTLLGRFDETTGRITGR